MKKQNKPPIVLNFKKCYAAIEKNTKPVLYVWKRNDSIGAEIAGTRELRKLAKAILAEVGGGVGD